VICRRKAIGAGLDMLMRATVRSGCYNVRVHVPDTFELATDEVAIEVLPELGARVHSIRAFGYEMLRTPLDPEAHAIHPFTWGGYHMVPWPNRVDAGPQPVLGETVDLRANHTDGTAIHGMHYVSAWEPADHDTFQVSGGGAGTGWPWEYDAAVRFAVEGSTVTIAYALTNTSDRTMPGGVGFHPWFRTPSAVGIPAAVAFPDNTDTAVRPDPVEGALDRRTPRPLDVGVDACWVDLAEPAVTLAWDDLGVGLTMSADDPAIVAVAAHLPDIDAVAVELQTSAPAGIRRLLNAEGHGLRALAPGETLALELTLAFTHP